MADSVLIRGGVVLTCADDGIAAMRADLLVEDGLIVELPTGETDADVIVDATGMLVIPGLVQAHLHLCQTLFRGFSDDLDVVEWLRTTVWPAEQAHDAASLRASADLSIAELLLSGTTAGLTIETATGTEHILDALLDSGFRAVTGPALMDMVEPGTGLVATDTGVALAHVRDLVERYDGAAGGRVRVALSPRGTNNATPELWREVARWSADTGLRMHTHASENAAQADRLEQAFGQRDAVALDAWGALTDRLTIAHGVWLDERERALVAGAGAHVCHCPSANLKLGSGIAPVPEYLGAGINVALGADGAACNNLLDGFEELRLAALLQKPRFGPQAVPAATAFRLATVGGARALGQGDRIGRLAPGFAADVVCLRRNRPHSRGAAPLDLPTGPLPDSVATALASELVYAGRAADVDTVLVDGEILVSGGRLTRMDLDAVVADAEAQREALRDRMSRA